MRVDKKRFIYLISPNKIKKSFYNNLKAVLSSNLVSYFQLRLKNYSLIEKKKIGIKIKKICKKYKVKLIINDDPNLAKKIGADGCHLGQNDMVIKLARKILRKKIIGITCHNSKKLIRQAVKDGANYIAIGAFFKSKTKKVNYIAKPSLISWVKRFTKLPVVIIGGITNKNFRKLLLHKPNFLAISGGIWDKKPAKAIKEFL
ncbi:thiamine phosphate synthase [Candidatus Pelagibacter communis]|uniref:thiamine phosphate synthase n=1 Tax=Pelagibacter ubique TaxID=198252 RepID=UPI0009E4E15F|nr:thiamine phosphate synthase [Candidatus Pelagibacter ubique]